MPFDNTLTTPRGIAVWPKLNTPDTKWKADGQFHTKLRFAADDDKFLALQAKLIAFRDAKYQKEYDALIAANKKVRADQLKKVAVGTVEVDEETGEETGFILLKVSSTASGVSAKTGEPWKRSPPIFDSKLKKLTNPPMISGGSILRCQISPYAYLSEKDKEIGVSCRLESVQLISLVSGGGRSASERGFEEEDGDEIEEATAAYSTDAAAADEGNDDL